MAEEKSGYGSTQRTEQLNPRYGKQQSLLSKPPQSVETVKIPPVIEKSSANIVNPIHHASKIIIWIYLLFAVGALVMTILEFVDFNKVLFIVLIFGTVILSVAGALGVYKWGTVQMQIDRFKGENAKYESNLVSLKGARQRVGGEVKEIQQNVTKLNKNVDDLHENLKQYDKLKQDLEEIAGDNKDLNDMINDINGMYAGMKAAVVQNQRSSMLEIFYDVQFRDKDKGLSQSEYKRFKSRLDKGLRRRFEKYGDFNQLAGADNVIDLREFQDVLEAILLDMEEDLLKNKD